jgi:succinate dehydrogenase/fumarate reductase flavoprotein subunit
METYGVIVLGTGAFGLTAALTAAGHGASVGLFEKGNEVGGTSAKSGGMIWIPGNHFDRVPRSLRLSRRYAHLPSVAFARDDS